MCVCTCVSLVLSVHERLIVSGGLTIKRLYFWRPTCFPKAPSLLFINLLLSKPLAALQPTQAIPPPPLPVCLSPARLLSFCASSSRSGGSGARVAVATCPIPIAGWIISRFCHLQLPKCTHNSDTHANFFTSASFSTEQRDLSPERQMLSSSVTMFL